MTDSGADRNWSCSRRGPVLPASPMASVPRIPSEPSVATHRRRLMAVPSRPHSPGFSSTAVLNRGMAGQKIRLPSTTSTAGNSVSMATSAHRMPAAPIGPNPLVLFRSAASRQSRPATTVAADATMAGAALRSAWTIATRTFSWWCSDSRYRAMSNSA
ncbi:hypothetical protein LUX73_28730 [Actinomadura madurae]|nr:hypothetical protein [Actinomadura madurae]MCQ0008290.1 hypothetical protein [Actinomadura madurae]